MARSITGSSIEAFSNMQSPKSTDPLNPLDNNAAERLIKRSVLNRKNAYFYCNETGAKIGDILMSVMETCVLNGVNPWDYLVAIHKHQKDVRKNPAGWVPWAYEKRLKELLSLY